jgi:hypothetical protein
MSRRRHAFIALALLPVFIALLVLWIRSFWTADELPLGRDGWALISRGGRIGYTNWPAHIGSFHRRQAAEDHYYRRLKQSLRAGERYPTTMPALPERVPFQGVGVDYAVITLPVGLLSLAFYMLHCRGQHIRRRRIAGGLCACCAYDLRASATDPRIGGPVLPRCPECGHERT